MHVYNETDKSKLPVEHVRLTFWSNSQGELCSPFATNTLNIVNSVESDRKVKYWADANYCLQRVYKFVATLIGT